MAEDFEDPRKTALRSRAAIAADAAGYTVDGDRPVVAYPEGSGLKGAIRADVVATGDSATRTLYFVRVDGQRALPQWLVNHVKASFTLAGVEIYVVVEEVGDQLTATCTAAGAGLLRLRPDDTFEKVLEYQVPDDSEERRRLQKQLKTARTRLDAKLRLNQAKLEATFDQSAAVVVTMTGSRRNEYLADIENALVAWRSWAEEISEQLDALAGTQDFAALAAINDEIVRGPVGVLEG